jgi:hypothetical protein
MATRDELAPSERWIVAVHCAFYAIVYVAVCWSPGCPALQDYPEWIHQGHIIERMLAGASGVAFEWKPYPVPYAASQLIIAGLCTIMSPTLAGKALVGIYLACGAWCSHRFVARHNLDPYVALPVLACVAVVNSCFWNGYMNYQLGVLLLMAYLSLSPARALELAVVLAFGLAAFACHAFILLGFALIVAAKALGKYIRTLARASLALAPSFALLAWYVLSRDPEEMKLPPVEVGYLTPRFFVYKLYTLAKTGPYHNFALYGVSDRERARALFLLGSAANLAVAGLLVVAAYRYFARANRARSMTWLAAGVLSLAFLFAPSQGLGVVNPGERVLYPALLCILTSEFLRGSRPERWLRLSLAPLLAAVLLASMTSLTVARATSSHAVSAGGELQVPFSHRPAQFEALCTDLARTAPLGRVANDRLAFPTSVLREKR